MMANPISIDSFQQFIRERYYQTDHARGTPATFLWLIEEVGELATALQAVAGLGQAGHQDDPDAAKANLEEEFADVLAWLCTLANINDVDLAAAVERKYLSGPGPQGHK